MEKEIRRFVLVWILSTIALVFCALVIFHAITEEKVTGLQFLGVVVIISVLNLMALRTPLWFELWDAPLPRTKPEKLSELEKKGPDK